MHALSSNAGRFVRILCTTLTLLAVIIADSRLLPAAANTFTFPIAGRDTPDRPFNYWVLTSTLGPGYHLGEDYTVRAPVGGNIKDTEVPIYAAGDGVVKHARPRDGYGWVVIIEHALPSGDPLGPSVTTLYGHLRADGIIKAGVPVTKGVSILGYLSSDPKENGTYSFTHLHFAVRKGSFLDACDPTSNGWTYAGYSTLYETCGDKNSTIMSSPDDPKHALMAAKFVAASEFIKARLASAPHITSVSPASVVGSTFDLTIVGTDFDATRAVDQVYLPNGMFMGQGTVRSRSTTEIVVTEMMAGAAPLLRPYIVKVENADGQLSSKADLTLLDEVSVSPNSAAIGTAFLYTGRGFTGNSTATSHLKRPDGMEFPTIQFTTSTAGTFDTRINSAGFTPGGYEVWGIDNNTGKSSSHTIFTVLPVNPLPTCTLSANPSTINQGQLSTLSWVITGGSPTSAAIDNGIGPVSTSGGRASVYPASTTTYTLMLKDASNQTETCSALLMVTPTPPSTRCNYNGICEIGVDSCLSCPDCLNNSDCDFRKLTCDRFEFVGGKPGPVYDQCVDDAHPNITNFLYYLSLKYGDPLRSTAGGGQLNDGMCNQNDIAPGLCGSVMPAESCYNAPGDCGPCPTIANITDLNIALGACKANLCSKNACQSGTCSNANACRYNCNSAHYGGVDCYDSMSVAVDFLMPTSPICKAVAKWSDDTCMRGVNWISYEADPNSPGILHVGRSRGSCLAYPDWTVPETACPSDIGDMLNHAEQGAPVNASRPASDRHLVFSRSLLPFAADRMASVPPAACYASRK
jgi:hypothetical protein